VSTAVLEKEKAVTLKKPRKIKLDIGTKTALIISVALLLLMVVFPLLNILTRASEGTGREVFANIFESAVTRKIILNTIILGTVVATIGTIIGFFLAYAQVKLNFRGKKLLHVMFHLLLRHLPLQRRLSASLAAAESSHVIFWV
jgi:iron(III) transport system permease protein